MPKSSAHYDVQCLVCGQPLDYRAEPVAAACHLCGRSGTTPMLCRAGHFVCDACHGTTLVGRLAGLTQVLPGKAPEEILEGFLALPELNLHGPEHHPLTALALLEACRRQGVALPEGWPDEAVRRSLQIPGGACGYLGACGAGIALGVAVSLATGATPVLGEPRALAHRASALGLREAGDGFPRCCKRACRRATAAGRHFFREALGIDLPSPPSLAPCTHRDRNRECPGEGCPFARSS